MNGRLKRFVLGFLCILVFAAMIMGTYSAQAAAKSSGAESSQVKEEITAELRVGKTKVTKKTYRIKAGAKKTLKVTASEEINSAKYVSSNTKVATVSKNGVIRAKKAGTARITVTVTTGRGSIKVWMKIRVNESAPTPTPDPNPTAIPTPKPSQERPGQDKAGTLVVYFTRTGNTETIADMISERTGGTKIRLETLEAYPEDYGSVYDIALKERNENARPELKTKIENMDTYDTVFVGYPIWHGDVPMAIRTFLEEYDFTGKKVIPFCTSGSSRPDTGFSHVRESAKGAQILDGFWTGSTGLGEVAQTVPQWLDGLELIQEKKEETKGDEMEITVGNIVFTAVLADNSSAAALKEMLAKGPLTIDMHDYANMEKVGPIGRSLPTNNEQISTEPGDIILYQGNSLVIYYDTNNWNLTRIGKISNVTREELLAALGSGNVSVTFSLK